MVIANSGPLMALAKLKLLDLLGQLYGQVILPAAVYDEVVVSGFEKGFADSLQVELAVQRKHLVVMEQPATNRDVDYLPLHGGEKAVLKLALQHKADLLLMDDMLAREQAHRFGFQVKGTLGVIVNAYREELLTIDEVRIFFDAVAARHDIWISEKLCSRVFARLVSR